MHPAQRQGGAQYPHIQNIGVGPGLDEDGRLTIAFLGTGLEAGSDAIDWPLPARDIAKLMGFPVEEVYRLKQRTQRWLKDLATRLNVKAG